MAETVLAVCPPDELRGRRVLVVMILPALAPEGPALRRWLMPLLVLRQAGAVTMVLPVLPVDHEGPGVVNEILAAALRQQGVAEARAVPGINGGALPYVRQAHAGEVLVMENLCQYRAGQTLDASLGRQMAAMADRIVCDDEEFADWLTGYGPLVMRSRPLPAAGWPSPSLAIVGGTDDATKAQMLPRLSLLVDSVALAGALAAELMQAQANVPQPWFGSPHWRHLLVAWWETAIRSGQTPILPEDYWLAPRDGEGIVGLLALSPHPAEVDMPVYQVAPPSLAPVDLGPRSLTRLLAAIGEARSILWSGPVGRAEHVVGEVGSVHIAHAIAKSRWQGKTTVAAGEATLALIHRHQLGSGFQYLLPASQDLVCMPPPVSRLRIGA